MIQYKVLERCGVSFDDVFIALTKYKKLETMMDVCGGIYAEEVRD